MPLQVAIRIVTYVVDGKQSPFVGRYDARYAKVGGVVRVKFYIEPTGRVVIGEVLQSPDEQLTKEVLRAIRASKGKWTPRKVDGVPQRTAYEFRCNYVNDGY